MALYEWKHPETGDIVESSSYDVPPKAGYVRVYSFGLGAVLGCGLSPSRYVNGRKSDQ
jgi:hypothetical protein